MKRYLFDMVACGIVVVHSVLYPWLSPVWIMLVMILHFTAPKKTV